MKSKPGHPSILEIEDSLFYLIRHCLKVLFYPPEIGGHSWHTKGIANAGLGLGPVTLNGIVYLKKHFLNRSAEILTHLSSEQVKDYFQKEETLRYTIPDREFPYTALDGKKSTVVPLMNISGEDSTKFRRHSVLKPTRSRKKEGQVMDLAREVKDLHLTCE